MEAGPNFLCIVRCQTAEGQPVIAEGLQQRRVFLPQHAEIPLQGGMEGVEHPAPGKVQSVHVIREGVKMDHIRPKLPDDLIESPVEPHSPGGLFGGQTQLRFPGAWPQGHHRDALLLQTAGQKGLCPVVLYQQHLRPPLPQLTQIFGHNGLCPADGERVDIVKNAHRSTSLLGLW